MTILVSFSMLGHLKFSVTLLGGYYLFNEPVSAYQVVGVAGTFCGSALFVYFKMAEMNRHKLE